MRLEPIARCDRETWRRKIMSIDGAVVLVTGAGQGIGRAIALRLAKDGAHIAIVDVNDRKMSAVAEEVKALGRKATTFKADVTKRDDVYAAIDHAEESDRKSTRLNSSH